MRNRIISAVVALSLAAGSVLPTSLAAAAPVGRPSATAGNLPVIQVEDHRRYRRDGDRFRRGGDRYRHDGDRYRHDRQRYRHERRADRRDHRYDHRDYRHKRDYRYDRRYDYRYGNRRYHKRHRGDDDTAVILGGLALGTILLLSIMDHENDRRYPDYRR